MWLPSLVTGRDLKRFLLEPGVVLDYGGLIDTMQPEEALREMVSRMNSDFQEAVSAAFREGAISQEACERLIYTWVDPFAEAVR